jgi:transcription initiation factor TFIIA large subunit
MNSDSHKNIIFTKELERSVDQFDQLTRLRKMASRRSHQSPSPVAFWKTKSLPWRCIIPSLRQKRHLFFPLWIFETDNQIVCQYDKIQRVKNRWRFCLKDGIMHLHGRDFVFQKATGEGDWWLLLLAIFLSRVNWSNWSTLLSNSFVNIIFLWLSLFISYSSRRSVYPAAVFFSQNCHKINWNLFRILFSASWTQLFTYLSCRNKIASARYSSGVTWYWQRQF